MPGVATTDDAEGGSAVEGASAGGHGDVATTSVDGEGVFLALFGGGAHANHAVFGLEHHLHTFRQVVGDEGGQTDTEVHNVAIMHLFGGTTGDKGFDVFFIHVIVMFLFSIIGNYFMPLFTISCAM